MKINEIVKKRRKQLNITQSEMADKLGTGPSIISNFENRKDYKNTRRLENMFELLNLKIENDETTI